MAREAYVERKFVHKHAQVIIDRANVILEEYAAAGQQMTLRQLFYQFVHRNWIVNDDKPYKNLGYIVSEARLAGLIDWDHVVDRTRFLRKSTTRSDTNNAVTAAWKSYREDKWFDQDYHIEVWLEKDALNGAFEEACEDYQLGLFSCRGYSSQSEMYNAAQRLIWYESKGKKVRILYFGDHDPSGLQMTEDVGDRLERFGCNAQVVRVSLTMEQIKDLKLPPNPTKLKDSRAAEYVKRFGKRSWELDAIPVVPVNHFTEMVKKHVLEVRDEKKWKAALRREKKNRDLLEKASKQWTSVTDHLEHGEERGTLRDEITEHIDFLAPGQRRSAFVRKVQHYIEGYLN